MNTPLTYTRFKQFIVGDKSIPEFVECVGVKVPSKYFLQPETCTPESIVKEPNEEVRRILIDWLGVCNPMDEDVAEASGDIPIGKEDNGIILFLAQGGGKTIASDDKGELLAMEFEDETIYYIQVPNSSLDAKFAKVRDAVWLANLASGAFKSEYEYVKFLESANELPSELLVPEANTGMYRLGFKMYLLEVGNSILPEGKNIEKMTPSEIIPYTFPGINPTTYWDNMSTEG